MLTKIYNDLTKQIPSGKVQRVKVDYHENVKLVTLLYKEEFYLFKIFQDEVYTIRRIT